MTRRGQPYKPNISMVIDFYIVAVVTAGIISATAEVG
jgi:hypothetical protein